MVVDKQVDRAKLGFGPIDHRPDLGARANVGANHAGASAETTNLAGNFLGFPRPSGVVDGDVSTLARQALAKTAHRLSHRRVVHPAPA